MFLLLLLLLFLYLFKVSNVKSFNLKPSKAHFLLYIKFEADNLLKMYQIL
jgi:hypothetical protein